MYNVQNITTKEEYIRWLASCTPLPISRVEGASNCYLSMGGTGWAFSSLAPSRIVAHDAVVLGSEDLWNKALCREVFSLLDGAEIVEIVYLDNTPEGELRLGLSNGLVVENFDSCGADAWMRIKSVT